MKVFRYIIPAFFVFIIGCSKGSDTLVTINGNKYTVDDFNQRFRFSPTDDSLRRKQMVDEFINQMLVVEEARQRNYNDDPIVKSALDSQRKEIIWRSYYEQKVVNRIKVSDAEARKLYDQVTERYHLAHIVLDNDSIAKFLESQLASGAEFESLLKYSLDTLSKNGDIGSFSVISIPPEILDKIKNVEVGEVTPVIKLGDYYHIFKVLEHTRKEEPKFEDVVENIKQRLRQQKINEAGEKFYNQILEKARIEYNPEGLEALTKPDSLITQEDLDKWVVKKYDTAYVRVRTIRNAVQYQYRKANVDPRKLIDNVLVSDLIYDAAINERFDNSPIVKKRLEQTLVTLLYQKLYSDEVLQKVVIDSSDVEKYYLAHKDEYKDKKLSDAYRIVRAKLREIKVDSLRNSLFISLRKKYTPQINEQVVAELIKGEK